MRRHTAFLLVLAFERPHILACQPSLTVLLRVHLSCCRLRACAAGLQSMSAPYATETSSVCTAGVLCVLSPLPLCDPMCGWPHVVFAAQPAR